MTDDHDDKVVPLRRRQGGATPPPPGDDKAARFQLELRQSLAEKVDQERAAREAAEREAANAAEKVDQERATREAMERDAADAVGEANRWFWIVGLTASLTIAIVGWNIWQVVETKNALMERNVPAACPNREAIMAAYDPEDDRKVIWLVDQVGRSSCYYATREEVAGLVAETNGHLVQQ